MKVQWIKIEDYYPRKSIFKRNNHKYITDDECGETLVWYYSEYRGEIGWVIWCGLDKVGATHWAIMKYPDPPS